MWTEYRQETEIKMDMQRGVKEATNTDETREFSDKTQSYRRAELISSSTNLYFARDPAQRKSLQFKIHIFER